MKLDLTLEELKMLNTLVNQKLNFSGTAEEITQILAPILSLRDKIAKLMPKEE